MVARYKPDVQWQVDWGDDDYAHAHARLGDDAAQWELDYGAGLQNQVGVMFPRTARGRLRVYNRGNLYNLDSPLSLGRDLLAVPHACRYVQDGVVRWQGRAVPTAGGRPVQRDGFVDWVLTGRHADRLSAAVGAGAARIVGAYDQDEGRLTLVGATLQQCAAAMTADTGIEVSVSASQTFGVIIWDDSWLQFLDALGRMTGGWFFEQPDGSFTHATLLYDMANPAGRLTPAFEAGFASGVYSDPRTVVNFAQFTSQQATTGTDVVPISAKPVSVPPGDSIIYSTRVPRSARLQGVEWSNAVVDPPRSGVTVTQAAVAGVAPSTALYYAARVNNGSSSHYDGRLVFQGRRTTLAAVDNSPIYAEAASIRLFGKRELDVPPWWPQNLSGAPTRTAALMRMASRPLRRVTAVYSTSQRTAGQSQTLASVRPGEAWHIDLLSDGHLSTGVFLVGNVRLRGTRQVGSVELTGLAPEAQYTSTVPGILDAGRVR